MTRSLNNIIITQADESVVRYADAAAVDVQSEEAVTLIMSGDRERRFANDFSRV